MLKIFTKKRNNILLIIFSISLLSLIFAVVDYSRIKKEYNPLFCFRVENKNHTFETWWGLGYKIQRELFIEPYQPRSDRDLQFGLWLYTKKVDITKKINADELSEKEYIKQILENETSLYNISVIAISNNDFYVLANDGTTPKSTFHYQLGDNGLSFVKHMRNDTNIRLINTTNTDRYAILYTRDQSLYKLAFDSLKLEKIDINEVESDLYDMYAYNDTVLFVYGLSNSNNKIVCLYNIYDYEEVSREEVKSYQINRVNNSLYIVDLNSKERTIKLQ